MKNKSNIETRLKILIMTNFCDDYPEDILLAQEFMKDGHEVALTGIDFSEKLDDIYDLFLKKCTWTETASNAKKYMTDSLRTRERLTKKGLLLHNPLDGKFDSKGKIYLYDLYKLGFPVIPTAKFLQEVEKMTCAKFRIKALSGYSGFGQKIVNKLEAIEAIKNGCLVQENIDFVSEVQFYYIDNVLQYVLEFTPSKIPIYPIPALYKATKSEIKTSDSFIKENTLSCGLQRVDFIKTKSGQLLLLEVEDSNPFCDLCDVMNIDPNLGKSFLQNYKKSVYDFYHKNTKNKLKKC